ncbi:MAG: diiron oxygenase [Polyangiaceae bacterium]
MTLQHNYSYPNTLHDSLKINWRVEDLIGNDKSLDFSRPFLPESLARVATLEGLDAREKLVLNHIRGATYLHLFGLVEEFILPFAVERARDGIHQSKDRVRALLTFAEEEAKHQQLFQRFAEEFKRGFSTPIEFIGPATSIAETVLAHSPLSVAILILHLEWLTQRHYLESVKTDERLDPQFTSLLKHHWQEEAQHAKIDTLVLEELASQASPAEIDKAIDEFLAIAGILEGGLQQQVHFDLDALERAIGRKLPPDVRAGIFTAQVSSYRWTFLVSGIDQENFSKALAQLSESGLERVRAAGRALT